jgi:hypothetical protein
VRPFALPPGALTTPSSIGTPVPMPKVDSVPQRRHDEGDLGALESAAAAEAASVFRKSAPLQVLLDSWNMNANVWLRECIYKRLAKKGRKPG